MVKVAAMGAVDSVFLDHIERLKAAVLGGHTLASVTQWITEKTTLKGQPFSFKDHEFQQTILNDPSREKNVRKCSQIGLSEMSIRAALAIANILEACGLIYTMPTASAAKLFAKTRFDPVISGSATLLQSISATADNTEMKQFNNSFMYIKGTMGQAAAISTPADVLMHDELDFSDPGVVTSYQSRLTHSPYKLTWKFSTPTVDGYGISAAFETSRKHWNFVKCNHCNHHFIPDYFKHVRIPKFKLDSLQQITANNLHQFNYRYAYVECPGCGKQPSLQKEYREYVVENTDSNYEAAGFQVQPFDAPNVITMGDLIHASTTYKRYADFINFRLGLPAEDKESTLGRAELEACFVEGGADGFWSHVMGIDMGMICHVMIAGVDGYGQMTTVKTEQVPLTRLVERYAELRRQYRVAVTVMDHQPYTETLMRLQKADKNLYGAVYVSSKNLQPFEVKKIDEENEDAQVAVRQVNVNRNKALDGLMTFVRGGSWRVVADDNKELVITHMMDMKRVQEFTVDREVSYVWRKSDKGNDHFHHAALYCYIASQMRGVAENVVMLPSIVSSFKIR